MPFPVSVIILEAGRSAQAGPPPSLFPFRGTTLLRHAAEAALRCRAEKVVVVLDPSAHESRRELDGLAVAIVGNDPAEDSVRARLRAGIRAVPESHQAVLVMETDQPLVSAEVLDALLLRYDAEPDTIVSSLCGQCRSLPAVFPRSAFSRLTEMSKEEHPGQVLAALEGVPTIAFAGGAHRCRKIEEVLRLDRLTTIIFDFGMVISTFEVARFLRNLIPYTGKSMTELKNILHVVRDIVIGYETGLMSTDEFISRIFHATNLPLTPEQFRLAYNDIFSPITSTHELIRRLKPHYRLGLLSNTSELHFHHAIRTTPVFPLFDAVTLSFEVKAMKPSRSIYDDMLAKLRAEPHECVYVDDIEENTAAAAWFGMHPIQYRNHEQLVQDLRRVGIVV
jgi:CTP:molybdopterin cytidylyltransferase MocA/FMN phosphatase YigB (HAD superfamily)